jgi:hypothetical protein
MMNRVIKLKRSGSTRTGIMRHLSKDVLDPCLDAEDCTHHCPMWFVLALASVGALGVIGKYFLG